MEIQVSNKKGIINVKGMRLLGKMHVDPVSIRGPANTDSNPVSFLYDGVRL